MGTASRQRGVSISTSMVMTVQPMTWSRLPIPMRHAGIQLFQRMDNGEETSQWDEEAIAVEQQSDKTYRLAVRTTNTYNGTTDVNWTIYHLSNTGVLDCRHLNGTRIRTTLPSQHSTKISACWTATMTHQHRCRCDDRSRRHHVRGFKLPS